MLIDQRSMHTAVIIVIPGKNTIHILPKKLTERIGQSQTFTEGIRWYYQARQPQVLHSSFSLSNPLTSSFLQLRSSV